MNLVHMDQRKDDSIISLLYIGVKNESYNEY